MAVHRLQLTSTHSVHADVVVQFYPWFKFSFVLFLGMVMYDNNMIMSLKQKKRKFEPRIKLNHNTDISSRATKEIGATARSLLDS